MNDYNKSQVQVANFTVSFQIVKCAGETGAIFNVQGRWRHFLMCKGDGGIF